jgi:hypothetical protein
MGAPRSLPFELDPRDSGGLSSDAAYQESLRALSKRYDVNQKTAEK